MTEKKTEKLDIVKLIEKDPITHLSQDYQSRLIEKIKSKFTEKEQCTFVASFFCYLKFTKNDVVIDLDDIWKWIGFSRKDPAKRLMIDCFVENIDYKIISHTSVGYSKVGKPTEQILMTVNTFKKFCLKAGTKKADEIHDYYIKLEELLHETVNEETAELRNQLALKDKILQEKDVKHKLDIKIERHKILIAKSIGKKCIYVGEIEEGKYVKVGSTKNIVKRTEQLTKNYGNFIFLEIFECENFRDIEVNILKDPVISKNLSKDKIKVNNELSREVVKLTDKFNYGQLLTIIKNHINNDKFLTPVQLLEKQKLDVEQQRLNNEILLAIINKGDYTDQIGQILKNTLPEALLDNFSINLNKHEIEPQQLKPLENVAPKYKTAYNIKVKGQKPKGRKIQKIDPDNVENIIKVYDSLIYVLRDEDNVDCKADGVKCAIKLNRIYKNFRWSYVEEGEDPKISKIKYVPLGKSQSMVNNNIILQLDNTKTKILESYCSNTKAAAQLCISRHRMSSIVKNGTQFNDSYFVEYNKCPKELLDKYEKPINKFIWPNNKRIKQIIPFTNEIIIHDSLTSVYIKLGFSKPSVKDAIENKTSLGGCLWEYYEPQNTDTKKDTSSNETIDSQDDNLKEKQESSNGENSKDSKSQDDDSEDEKPIKIPKSKPKNKTKPIVLN